MNPSLVGCVGRCVKGGLLEVVMVPYKSCMLTRNLMERSVGRQENTMTTQIKPLLMNSTPTPEWIPCDGENDWQGECRWCRLLFPDGSEDEGSWEDDEEYLTGEGYLESFRWRWREGDREQWSWTTYDPQPTHFQLFPEDPSPLEDPLEDLVNLLEVGKAVFGDKPKFLPPEAQDLLSQLVRKNASKTPTIPGML